MNRFNKFFKRCCLVVTICLAGVASSFAQEHLLYFFKTSDSANLSVVQRVEHDNSELSIATLSNDFSEFLETQVVYEFRRAFPQAKTRAVRHIFLIALEDSSQVSAFLARPEIEAIVRYNPELKGDYPNDFYDDKGRPNTALQLIKAPQAWTLTHGDSTVVVGVSDRRFEEQHEDLQGKIAKEIHLGGSTNRVHGTGVASVIAANTNNGKGIASIGYNTQLTVVAGNYSLPKGLARLINIPGMRVINCSWSYCNPGEELKQRLDSLVRLALKRNILIVSSAGNGGAQPCRLNGHDRYNGYRFPGSFTYGNVMSVTSVGHKFPIGNDDPKYGRTAWRDCHQNTPSMTFDPKTTHTHNDRVDICAPGWHVKVAREGNTYAPVSGTSVAAPFVTGTAALMFAVNPDLSAVEAKDILKVTADDIYHIKYNKQFKGQLGAGRLNAYKAVLIAKLLALHHSD